MSPLSNFEIAAKKFPGITPATLAGLRVAAKVLVMEELKALRPDKLHVADREIVDSVRQRLTDIRTQTPTQSTPPQAEGSLGHYGIMVGRMTVGDETFFAEVTPAGHILPYVSRWWFEVQSDKFTYAYEPGGSGGAFTLAGCISKADDAVQKFAYKGDK